MLNIMIKKLTNIRNLSNNQLTGPIPSFSTMQLKVVYVFWSDNFININFKAGEYKIII